MRLLFGLQTMEKLSHLQKELDELNGKQSDLETEVQHDVLKLEAVKLLQKLQDVRMLVFCVVAYLRA